MKPTLEFGDVNQLREYTHRNYVDKRLPNGGMTEHWYNSVCEFIEMKKGDIIPVELKKIEESLVTRGLSKEYLAALLDAEHFHDLPDDQKLLTLVMTSSQERMEAILKLEKYMTAKELESCKQLKVHPLKLVR